MGDEQALALRIAGIMLPVFLIALAGCVYGARVRAELGDINRLNMDVFVPALVFSVLATGSFPLLEHGALVAGVVIIVTGSGLLALPLAWLGKIRARTLLPPVMFNNCGNLGLPLASLTFGEAGLVAAVTIFAASNLLHFSVGVTIMSRGRSARDLLRVPVLWATVLGVAWSGLSLPLPGIIATPLDMLGRIVVPLMLFTLGMRMNDISFAHWKNGLAGGLACPLAGLVMFLAVRAWLDLSAAQEAYLLLFAVLPPAVLNFLLAERYQCEPDKVAAMVLIGNLAALAVLPLTLPFVISTG